MRKLAFALAVALSFPAHAGDMKFVTEEYPPFNYSRNGEIAGIAVEQLRLMADAAGLSYTIEIMPWARAIALAESRPMHCVFTTGHNAERAPKFVWVKPLLEDRMVMVRRKGADVKPETLDDAMKLRVGSQRDDFAVEFLRERGYQDIDLATGIELTLGKLLSDRIDLMPTSVKTFKKMVQDGYAVEQAMLMEGQVYGIACHRDTPADIVARLQAALDELITSGEQDRIFARYGLPPNMRTAAQLSGQ